MSSPQIRTRAPRATPGGANHRPRQIRTRVPRATPGGANHRPRYPWLARMTHIEGLLRAETITYPDETVGRLLGRVYAKTIGDAWTTCVPGRHCPGDTIVDVRGISFRVLWSSELLVMMFSVDRQMCEFALTPGLPPHGVDGYMMSPDQLAPTRSLQLDQLLRQGIGLARGTATQWLVELIAREMSNVTPCPATGTGILLVIDSSAHLEVVWSRVAADPRVVRLLDETRIHRPREHPKIECSEERPRKRPAVYFCGPKADAAHDGLWALCAAAERDEVAFIARMTECMQRVCASLK
jgi:hypothetical protein